MLDDVASALAWVKANQQRLVAPGAERVSSRSDARTFAARNSHCTDVYFPRALHAIAAVLCTLRSALCVKGVE